MKLFGWTMQQWFAAGAAHDDVLRGFKRDQSALCKLLQLHQDWQAVHVYAPLESPIVNESGSPTQ